MSEHLSVDVNGLQNGGLSLEEWSHFARQIAVRLRTATTRYQHAGGGGEMGEQWDKNYTPGATQALEFLAMLEEIVGGSSGATLLTAQVFDQANITATSRAKAE
jgi:hypothetical protein